MGVHTHTNTQTLFFLPAGLEYTISRVCVCTHLPELFLYVALPKPAVQIDCDPLSLAGTWLLHTKASFIWKRRQRKKKKELPGGGALLHTHCMLVCVCACTWCNTGTKTEESPSLKSCSAEQSRKVTRQRGRNLLFWTFRQSTASDILRGGEVTLFITF